MSLDCAGHQLKSQFSHQLGSEVTFALSLDFLTCKMGEKWRRICGGVEPLVLDIPSRRPRQHSPGC